MLTLSLYDNIQQRHLKFYLLDLASKWTTKKNKLKRIEQKTPRRLNYQIKWKNIMVVNLIKNILVIN